jgi:tetratricopeptide (TPR) repeat protein
MTRLKLLAALCFVAVHPPGLAHPGAQETLEHLNGRIAADPDRWELFYQRGVSHLESGQYENARRDLEHAAALGDPRHSAYQLGVVNFRTDNYSAALACFDRYLSYQPGHSGSLRFRARLHGINQNYSAALGDYQALFERPEQTTPADYIAASELLIESPEHEIDHAIDVLDQGMVKLGVVSQLQYLAIELELNRGQYYKAIERQQSLAPNPPGNPFWQVEMGRLLLAAGEEQSANRHFLTAQQQLNELRKTPARVQLAQELQLLKTN